MLESQLTSKETELREQAILHEREISDLNRIHDVGTLLDSFFLIIFVAAILIGTIILLSATVGIVTMIISIIYDK